MFCYSKGGYGCVLCVGELSDRVAAVGGKATAIGVGWVHHDHIIDR